MKSAMNRGWMSSIMRDLTYVDTSALISSQVNESHSQWAMRALEGRSLTSSIVTDVELTRYAKRQGHPMEFAQRLSVQISFIALNGPIVELSKGATEKLKSLDAIHLGTWIYLSASGLRCDFVTADRKLAAAALAAGARVIHPFGEAEL